MMKSVIAVAVLAMAGTAMLATASANSTTAIEVRKEGFKAFKKEMGGIKKIVEAGSAERQADLLKHALALEAASKKQWESVEAHFASGTDKGNTDALPAIWEKPEDFKAAIKKNAEAVSNFVNAARASDVEGWKKAFGSVGGSCKNCHDQFKKS